MSNKLNDWLADNYDKVVEEWLRNKATQQDMEDIIFTDERVRLAVLEYLNNSMEYQDRIVDWGREFYSHEG